MAYNPLADVNISLATATFERVGFGTPLFIASTRAFETRTQIYNDLPAVVAGGHSTTSAVYLAAQSVFSPTNGLNKFIVGRREANSVISIDHAPAQNEAFGITIGVNDGDSVVINYVEAGASPTQESVLTAIRDLIDADTEVAAHVTTVVSGSGAAATLTISATTATDVFTTSAISNLVETFTSSESAADVYSAVARENDSFYTVSADDKTTAFVLEMAATVNAQEKQYWVSINEADSYGVLSDPATDTLGQLRAGNFARVVGIYHQDAERTYPELAELGFNLPFSAGQIVWGNDVTTGVAASANESGQILNVQEKTNLLARNAAFWDRQGGQTFFNSDVFTMSGERPENIRGLDAMAADMKTEMSSFLLRQVGSKVPYNDVGIAQVESVIDRVLSRYVQRGFIEAGYVITVPRANTISADKRASQLFDELTFVAQLTGAITMTEIRGTLQLDEVVQ